MKKIIFKDNNVNSMTYFSRLRGNDKELADVELVSDEIAVVRNEKGG